MPFGVGPLEIILIQLIMLAVPIGAVGFFGWLGLRYVRTREREAGRHLTEPAGRVEVLQESVEALQAEVRVLRERTDFVEKLLEQPRAPGS